MKKIATILLVLAFVSSPIGQFFAQKTFPTNGVLDQRDGLYAFVNATIYKSYNQKLEAATLIIKEGKVISCGVGIPLPVDAIIVECQGKTIYPSFIDVYADYGMLEITDKPVVFAYGRGTPQYLTDKRGAYAWNEAIKPEIAAHTQFSNDAKNAKEWRGLGFGSLVSHQQDGIARGTSVLVSTADKRPHEAILKERAASQYSFSKGTSSQNYPSSLMGVMALLRQTELDADWYAKGGNQEERNLSLEAWNEQKELPRIIAVGDWLEALRADKLANEFNRKYIIKGVGDEYRRVAAMKKTGTSFIIPLNFPAAYDVEDPYEARKATLQSLKHWEYAPQNAKILSEAGVDFAFTLHGLKDKTDFYKNIRKAIKSGLTEEAALKALTETPARMVNAEKLVGSLENGRYANFFITNGNVFEDKTSIVHHWVQGMPYILKEWSDNVMSGKYNLTVGDNNYALEVYGENGNYKTIIKTTEGKEIVVNSIFNKEFVTLSFADEGEQNRVRLSGVVGEKKWYGRGELINGEWVEWTATHTSDVIKENKEEKPEVTAVSNVGTITYPFMAYGYEQMPKQEKVLFKNATVWTNEADGILKETDVLINEGKIVRIGKSLKGGGAIEIDATDKHLTCGVIDEHSHIATSRGINESAQASSAEVSIADVINSEDINIYRQLAGGVTTSHILHGSANPIGGQSGLIKLRWGSTPDEMLFKGADKFIKFALGENVKQSNWGDVWTSRFPQTRMGVEQHYEDYFTRAAEYKKLKNSGKPYRKDLDMETIVEVLDSECFITCHSYRQSEINMLMKVAERHGFKINTFTHILEGYKVADKMKEHGVAGSTFSDWWAYKYEVIDAIPRNGEILHKNGVLTAFNSDDAEMARRLNQEAAKAVKYGDLSEEEAWKFVTLNPAEILHIDNRVGSIKVGKDADVVLWSENPLSVYAKAEMTFVDGIKYFDREEDKKMQTKVKDERTRLIQKMLVEKKNGGETQAVKEKHHHHYHCDHFEDEGK